MRTESDLLRRTVLHADETPIPMLKPGLGHTHRAYLWSYGTTEYDPAPIVVYDFAEGRSGRHARTFLGEWTGTLVCDDYVGYKALFKKGVIEAGCMAPGASSMSSTPTIAANSLSKRWSCSANSTRSSARHPSRTSMRSAGRDCARSAPGPSPISCMSGSSSIA